MLAKTLVVYSMCSLLTYILCTLCVFFRLHLFQYGGLLYRPMKKKVKGEGWLTGLSRYMNDKEIVIK